MVSKHNYALVAISPASRAATSRARHHVCLDMTGLQSLLDKGFFPLSCWRKGVGLLSLRRIWSAIEDMHEWAKHFGETMPGGLDNT